MAHINQNNYWDERGRISFLYKGERFYTITPIPFYYKRRKILIKMLKEIMSNDKIKTICDYGCGDGYYLKLFSSYFPDKKYYGIDISQEMISLARKQNPDIEFYLASSPPHGNVTEVKYDFVYSIAVFAHIMSEEEINGLFTYLYSLLADGGKIVFFEQTGQKEHSGLNWVRRTNTRYIEIAERCGFRLISSKLITFAAHRFFERYIAKYYKKYFIKGDSYEEKCINANKSKLFRILSNIFMFLSIFQFIKKDSDYGNTLFVFGK